MKWLGGIFGEGVTDGGSEPTFRVGWWDENHGRRNYGVSGPLSGRDAIRIKRNHKRAGRHAVIHKCKEVRDER